MQVDTVKQLILNTVHDATVLMEGDGRHFTATVISPAFQGKSRLARQQMVYEAVKKELASGTLHALSIKTFTPEEYNHGQVDH
jgi:acid stress-induced BolA-like protein IbaG/YrbA